VTGGLAVVSTRLPRLSSDNIADAFYAYIKHPLGRLPVGHELGCSTAGLCMSGGRNNFHIEPLAWSLLRATRAREDGDEGWIVTSRTVVFSSCTVGWPFARKR